MGLIERLFNRNPEERANREHLKAAELMQKAEQAPTVHRAIPFLERFKKLVEHSNTKDTYQPKDAEEILARKIFEEAKHNYPRSIRLNEPPGRPSLEDALDMTVNFYSHGAPFVGLKYLDPKATRKLAFQRAYQDLTVPLVATATTHHGDPQADMLVLLEDYDTICSRHVQYVGEEPSFLVRTPEGRSVPLTTFIYTQAFTHTLTVIQKSFEELTSLELAEPAYHEWFSHQMEVFDYLASCDPSALASGASKEELEEIAPSILSEKAISQHLYNCRVEEAQDQLDRTFKKTCADREPREVSETLLERLAQLTEHHSGLLGETAQDIYKQGQAILARTYNLPEASAKKDISLN